MLMRRHNSIFVAAFTIKVKGVLKQHYIGCNVHGKTSQVALSLCSDCSLPFFLPSTKPGGEKRAKRNEKAISESAQQQMSHKETILARMEQRAHVARLEFEYIRALLVLY